MVKSKMTDLQIQQCAGIILHLARATESCVSDILELLSGNVIDEEDCGRIRDAVNTCNIL